MSEEVVVKIEKFLGLNLSSGGDTNLKVGELSTCDNIRIIENYKARKREGYNLIKNLGTSPINHIAKLGTKYIVAAGTSLLEIDESEIEP
jgi:hypothetical protein